jgi:F0F1-type ATP synthase membrane subunit c/vacuolar-type H+-ATPase subunit K
MRKITLSLFALLVTIVAYCGAPQAFNYQAAVSGPTGAPVKSKPVALRLSILDGSAAGPVVYQERQAATTDASGLVNLQIGNGTVLSGTFSTISWPKGAFFLKAEVDTNGGTAYLNVGTVQFLSVPYALYADKSNIASPDYPDGLMNITPIRQDGNFNYIVPTGQTLYITQLTHNGSASCSSYGAVLNGVFLASGAAATGTSSSGIGQANTGSAGNKTIAEYPLTIPEGQAVTSTSCGTSMVGFTVPKGYSFVNFDLNTGNYTVPAGKILVIKNFVSSSAAGWNGYYSVNGLKTTFNKTPTFADAGQTVSVTGLTGSMLMMGYLKDK